MNSITVFSVVFALLSLWAYSFLTKETQPIRNKNHETAVFAVFVLVITAFKVYISGTFYGHSSDMSLFSAWSYVGAEGGLGAFYAQMGKEYFVDYPPLYLYVLTAVGKLLAALGVTYGSDVYVAAIKFIPVLADAVSAILVYRLAAQEGFGKKAGVLSLLILLNPAYILNSSIWGQIDGLYTLIIISLLFSIYKKKYLWAVISFAVGILTKPQMIIFLPTLGFWLIFDVIGDFKENKSKKVLLDVLAGTLISVVFAALISYPMVKFDVNKFFNIYKGASVQYPYATLNAANIYGAIGKNWALYTEKFMGLTFKSWGFVFIILSSFIIGIGTYFKKNRHDVFILGAFNVFSIFTLAHTMHERYSFSLILVLLISFILTKDKRMFFAFSFSSVLCFVQTGLVLLDNEGIINFTNLSFVALSWVTLVFFAYMCSVWFKMLVFNDVERIKSKPPKILCIKPQEKKITYTKKDALIVTALTCIYALGAFYNLGSNHTPQKPYEPFYNNESVILDLGKNTYIHRVNMYTGLIARRELDGEIVRSVSFSFATDENTFGEQKEILTDSVFRWTGFFANQEARYIKITSDENNFEINEVAVFDRNKNLIPIKKIISDNNTAQMIADEQECAVYEYTWYDGTYFDEIYHPRTALEYLKGISPYENTHPPLGKLFISLGMCLFGVTPFGWRFFGTLAGVLMVPIMFVFSKQILKESKWAGVATFLLTFDFMHLAQTRLATIDSFTALFVLLMFYYMHKYTKLNFYNTGVRKTLKPLFLSGLFFGLGIATKWQGAYAGIGLAVMFFVTLYKRFKEYRAACCGMLVGDSEKIKNSFIKYACQTLFSAVAFFVIIPLGIYFLSYLPIILSENETLGYFWQNQISMLSYHSSLTETHPYGSPWWSWPLDLRPLYAYNPNRDFVKKGISQGISSFGNPLVWWLTIPSIAYLVYKMDDKEKINETSTVLVGFLAMFMPWAVISRQAFIYHFFPCVAFVCIAIAFMLRAVSENNKKLKIPIVTYLALVFLLYAAYYPVLTGIKIPEAYADMLSWLPTWVLG